MTIINVMVDDQRLEFSSMPVVASEGVQETYVKFALSSDWSGFGAVALFYRDDDPESVYESALDGTGLAEVPHEITAAPGWIRFGLSGSDGTAVHTSEILKYKVVKGLYTSGQGSEPPAPGIYEQMLAIAGDMRNTLNAAVIEQNAIIQGLVTDMDDLRSDMETEQTTFESVVTGQINTLVNDFAGSSRETVLFEGSHTVNIGDEIDLVSDPTVYDYLDIVLNDDIVGTIIEPTQNSQWRVTGETVKSTGTSVTTYVIEGVLDAQSLCLRVSTACAIVDTGTSSTRYDLGSGSIADESLRRYCLKVIGRKLTDDAEVLNIRVGADGVTYQTAGTAVRSQLDKKLNAPISGGTVDYGTSGQLLATDGQGNTEWVNSTIPDGSITLAKLAPGVIDTTYQIQGAAASSVTVGQSLASKADASDLTAIDDRVTAVEGDIGDLSDLTTTVKTDLVSAINEVAQNTSSDYILLNDANNQKWKITISTTGVLTTEKYVSVSRTLSNVNYYEDFEGFENGQEYIETFIAVDGYTMEGATVSITMGGEDITSSVYSDLGAVIIPEVTGDVVISIQAVQINYVVPPASDFTLQAYAGKQAIKAYVGTDTAIEVPTMLTVNGQEYQTSMWECTFPSTVEHIKLNAIPAAYGAASALAPKIPNTVKTLWLVGDDGRSYGTPASAERIVRPSSCNGLGNAHTRVTSLRDAVYKSSLTSLASGCSNATSLVDGGTIPSTISNIYYLFNGATKLRRARIEGKTFSNFASCFTNVPKNAIVQLYLDSDIYTTYRNNASNAQMTNDNSIPVMFESIDPTTPIRYLFCIGDSLTLGTGSTTIATDSYPALLKGMFSEDVFVKNVGAGSTTSANHLNTMNGAPLNYYYANKDNGFIIWSGTNGVNSTVRSDIQSMVNLLGGNEHYLVIPAAVTGGGYTYEQQLAWALETFGAGHVFDVYGYFADNGYDRAEYMSDSLHYNTAGYAIIADGIYDKISGWF